MWVGSKGEQLRRHSRGGWQRAGQHPLCSVDSAGEEREDRRERNHAKRTRHVRRLPGLAPRPRQHPPRHLPGLCLGEAQQLRRSPGDARAHDAVEAVLEHALKLRLWGSVFEIERRRGLDQRVASVVVTLCYVGVRRRGGIEPKGRKRAVRGESAQATGLRWVRGG